MTKKASGYFGKNGQTTMEFVVLFIVIIASLIAMQVYLKRGIQGHIRESTDQLGQQYSPGYTTSNMITDTVTNVLEEVNTGKAGNGETVVSYDKQWQNRHGTETVMQMANEYWGK